MKRKFYILFLCALFGINAVWADGGFWTADRSWITINGTVYQVYNNGDVFSTNALGTFNVGDAITISAYDAKTWKNNGGDVTGITFYYTVYPTDSRPATPSFTAVSGSWLANLEGSDQQWGFSGQSININPNIVGNYTLEFYAQISGANLGAGIYDNGAGTNNIATFTIPYWASEPTLNVNFENSKGSFYDGNDTINDMAVSNFVTYYNINHNNLYDFTQDVAYIYFTKFFKLGGKAKTNVSDAQIFLVYNLFANSTGEKEGIPTGTGEIELIYNSETGYWEAPPNFDILAPANVSRHVYSKHPYDVEFWYEIRYNGETLGWYSNDDNNYWFRFNTTPFPIEPSSISVSINNTVAETATHEDSFADVNTFKLGGTLRVNDYKQNMAVSDEAAEVAVKLNYKIFSDDDLVVEDTSIPMTYANNSGITWGEWSVAPAADIISTLSAGTYTIHIWYTATIDNLTVYDSNGGANYQLTVTKTIVPAKICALRKSSIEISLTDNVNDYITEIIVNGSTTDYTYTGGAKLISRNVSMTALPMTVEIHTAGGSKLIKKFW